MVLFLVCFSFEFLFFEFMAATPSVSRGTQRSTQGWSSEECAKMDKYLRKEAAGDVIPPEKWERAFPRHSVSGISAKRRHQMLELQKGGLQFPSPPKTPSKAKDKATTQVQRNLFNTVMSGLQGNPSSSQQPFISPSFGPG